MSIKFFLIQILIFLVDEEQDFWENIELNVKKDKYIMKGWGVDRKKYQDHDKLAM